MWIVARWSSGVTDVTERDRSVCPILVGTMLLAMIVHQDEWECVENKGRQTRETQGLSQQNRPDQTWVV